MLSPDRAWDAHLPTQVNALDLQFWLGDFH